MDTGEWEISIGDTLYMAGVALIVVVGVLAFLRAREKKANPPTE